MPGDDSIFAFRFFDLAASKTMHATIQASNQPANQPGNEAKQLAKPAPG
jgi:hypothetical protein